MLTRSEGLTRHSSVLQQTVKLFTKSSWKLEHDIQITVQIIAVSLTTRTPEFRTPAWYSFVSALVTPGPGLSVSLCVLYNHLSLSISTDQNYLSLFLFSSRFSTISTLFPVISIQFRFRSCQFNLICCLITFVHLHAMMMQSILSMMQSQVLPDYRRQLK